MSEEPVFDAGAKKKKKKVAVNFDETADGKENAEADGGGEGEGDMAAVEPAAPAEQDDVHAAELADMFGEKKKKKKKPKAVVEESSGAEGAGGEHGADVAGADLIDYPLWPDHTYDELLERVYAIMREKNPELATGEKKKFVMKPPVCMRVGSKKTGFANFAEICRLLKRNQKHVLQFILAELGTSGSVDGNNQLIVKGRFQQKHFELVLKKYIKEYVTCHTCKSPDTVLEKDTRLFFLQCNVCGSRCSVATIKSGFVANTTRRAAIRAATGQ